MGLLCRVTGKHVWKDDTITEGVKRLRCTRCGEIGYPVPSGRETLDTNLSANGIADAATETENSQAGQETRAPN
jgi:hypothetical protein